jgi:hypothetical protein
MDDFYNKFQKYEYKKNKLSGGKQSVIVNKGVEFNSVGLILINQYSGVDNVVLFNDISKPFCDLLGGRIEESHQTIEDALSQEIFEESRKMLSIDVNILKEIDAKNNTGFIEGRKDDNGNFIGMPGNFKYYVAKFRDVSRAIYVENHSIMGKRKDLPKSFNETSALIRIPFDNMYKYLQTVDKDKKLLYEKADINDHKGNPQTVAGQAIRACYDAFIVRKLNPTLEIKNIEHKHVVQHTRETTIMYSKNC